MILKFYGFLNRGELHSNHIFSSFLTAMSQISSSPKSAPVRKILIFRACDLSSSPTSLYSVISLHLLIVKFRSAPVYDFQRLLTLHQKFLTYQKWIPINSFEQCLWKYSQSPTYKPSSCKLSKIQMCAYKPAIVLLCFSRYCMVRLKMFSLLFGFVFYVLLVCKLL